MIYRVTAKFFDTEDAQRAARRISGITGDVYEVRLSYRGDYENNDLVYAQSNIAELDRGYGEHLRFSSPLGSVDGIPEREISKECYMNVFCKDEINAVISEAIINCGGYDIEIKEEKLL